MNIYTCINDLTNVDLKLCFPFLYKHHRLNHKASFTLCKKTHDDELHIYYCWPGYNIKCQCYNLIKYSPIRNQGRRHRGAGGAAAPPKKIGTGAAPPLPKRKNNERRRKMTKVHCAPKKSYGPFSAITHLRGNTDFLKFRENGSKPILSLCVARHDMTIIFFLFQVLSILYLFDQEMEPEQAELPPHSHGQQPLSAVSNRTRSHGRVV